MTDGLLFGVVVFVASVGGSSFFNMILFSSAWFGRRNLSEMISYTSIGTQRRM